MPRPSSAIAHCRHCGGPSPLISRALSLCPGCIKAHFEAVFPLIREAHAEARQPFGLPPQVPRETDGVRCQLCLNQCCLAEGQTSYCGLRVARRGHFSGVSADLGNVSWYYDPLPTNCVADWVCPGGTGVGYPQYAYRPGPEYGYQNLAVFYHACSFDCLFCQNWHYRSLARPEGKIPASLLARQVDERTSCICYFGGDPTPQLPHALRTSRLALSQNRGRILRICWETNGSMHPALLRQMAELSLASGGCIKFDLKAWSRELHIALCGVSNQRTLENFRWLARFARQRPVPPLLVASTLLVPGHVDRQEVQHIAAFIASLDKDIPYSLLAFHPQFWMTDLPTTSRRHARECLEEAQGAGLTWVRVGNLHLLGDAY